MKSINAKRIAAVAASLLMGLAFAAGTGGVTWSNIPIINNQGQPVVQVVVGSTAQPSDGVVAANIAAVLGNMAFTTQNVTLSNVSTSGVSCVVTTPTCTLTNQQVWFNEKGFSTPVGSYAFTALIGSVLNGGVQLGAPQNTKGVSGSTSYAYPETGGATGLAIQISPAASPFSTNHPPTGTTPQASSNGGGVTFSNFYNTTNNFDNLLRVTSAQLPSLLNSWGPSQESENLWITGFPVYDQQQNSNPSQTFAVFGMGGAYQVVFNKPINEPYYSSSNLNDVCTGSVPCGTNSINNAAIELLGKNWTILNYQEPTGSVSSTNAISGGKLELAASLTPYQTIYVGHNITSNNFSVQLTDLGQPNSNGISPAAVDVFYNGNLTNVTQLYPPSPGVTSSVTKFTVGTHSVYVNVNATFAGLYAYQKWAKMKLYSNVLNITSGGVLNQTNAPHWNDKIYWTNGTSTSGRANQLQSLVIWNVTPTILTPGGTFTFVAPNYTAYKVNFVGDSLGTNYDPIQISSQANSQWGSIQNLGGNVVASNTNPGITNLTSQSAQILQITSQIPGAFTYAGQQSSSLWYDLTPYALFVPTNSFAAIGNGGVSTSIPTNLVITAANGNANIITSTSPLQVTLTGYSSDSPASSGGLVSYTVQVYPFTAGSATNTIPISQSFFNITNVYYSKPLPSLTSNVVVGISPTVGFANVIASYAPQPPEIVYPSGKPQWQYSAQAASGATVTYNQQQAGQSVVQNFAQLSVLNPTPATKNMQSSVEYFTVNIPEYDVPSSTSSQDALAFGVYNSTTAGAQSFAFQLNESTIGSRNNMTYTSSQGNQVQAPTGFVTERGSKVATISPTSVTINYAKTVDMLQFVVSPTSTVINSTSTTQSVGPVGVGQAVPGFSNLTVSQVNATCAFSSTSCSVTGLSNITGSASVTQAVVPVQLNTATTPLVVLDSNANSAATLIVVGSKYVNSVAGQIFAQNPSLNSSFSPSSVVVQAYGTNRILVAGYTANQTVQAGNQFITDLLQSASTP